MDRKPPKWAIQVTLISMTDSDGLHDAITEQGMECLPVFMKPFSDELPEIDGLDDDDSVIFYGSTKMIELVSQSGFNPGVWFDDEKFQYSHHVDLNGDLMLNHDATYHRLGDVIERKGPFFVRPTGDLKLFSGELMALTEDLYRWQEKLKMAGLYDVLDTTVMVASPKLISDEYRCFVVDGVIASAAKYVDRGQRKDTPIDESELAELQDIVTNATMPMSLVVCDIARTSNGMKIIEFNCLNASGFYGHDKAAIVKAVSAAV